MLSYTILLYSLTGKKECELCRKPCMLKHLLRHQHTIQGGEIYQMSPIINMTVRKDVLTSHQRVHTSVLVLKVDMKRKFLFSHMKVHEKQE